MQQHNLNRQIFAERDRILPTVTQVHRFRPGLLPMRTQFTTSSDLTGFVIGQGLQIGEKMPEGFQVVGIEG
jgi:hypothetical protein